MLLHLDAVNKSYTEKNFLQLNGASPMIDDLDMGSERIVCLREPERGSHAATKNYVDTELYKEQSIGGTSLRLEKGSTPIDVTK